VTDERENDNSFEAELRAFGPVAPSRRLYDGVEREVTRNSGRPLRTWYAFAGAAAAIAACVFAGVALWRTSHPDGTTPPGQISIVTTVPATGTTPGANNDDEDRPSLAVYRRALSDSPSALDALFDRHAARLLPAGRTRAASADRITASTPLELLR